jgi:hypothetical protein
MISHPHKVLFVHIPKCGGQSVETAFLNDLGLNWGERAPLLLRKRAESERGPDRIAHLTLNQYYDFFHVNEDIGASYFKFALIRHPFSRAVSFYNYLGYSNKVSLEQFICALLPELVKREHPMSWFFRPQADYIETAYEFLTLDEIICLEDITSSWRNISERLLKPIPKMPQTNVSKKSKQDQILSENSKSVVKDLYGVDLEIFSKYKK